MTLKIAIVLILGGFVMCWMGFRMPRYRDAEEYQRRYMELSGPTRTDDFNALRQRSLTGSLKLQDYGITTILVGCLVGAAAGWRRIAVILPQKK